MDYARFTPPSCSPLWPIPLSFFRSHNQVERVIQRHVAEDMQAVARITAYSIEDNLAAQLADVKTLAKEFGSKEKNRETFRREFDHLHEKYRKKVLFVSYVGPNGRLRYTYPETPSSIGKDLTYQTYMRDFLTHPHSGISPPFTTVEGPKAVSIYAPVWKPDSTFDGMITVLINVNVLEKRLTDSRTTNMQSYLRVIARDGTIIGSSLSGECGRNLWELREEYNQKESRIATLTARQDSLMFASHDNQNFIKYVTAVPGSDGEIHEKIASFHRIDVGRTTWSLMYVVLQESVRNKVKEATTHQWYIWGFMLLILAVTSTVLIVVSIKWGHDLNATIEETTAELRRTERRCDFHPGQ
ncbi:MAG: hypothetical protein MAGBODY4_00728 [Candidatus Marinimicrobia bacterium]|nr:hypothetical protein [Candidatus Neomarinimicrobiota bacterium]